MRGRGNSYQSTVATREQESNMIPSDQHKHTIEEFKDFLANSASSDRRYELIDGIIVEKNFYTDKCSTLAGKLLYVLTDYVQQIGYGRPGPSRTFSVPGNIYNARTPNISMIVIPDVPLSTERIMAYVPEFIAEIKTPDDRIDLLRDKAQFYISNGVQLVWLVYPRQKLIEVHRPNQLTQIMTETDTLEEENLLPGFKLPIGEVFPTKRSGQDN